MTYREMGRYEEALADFSRAIELDPGNAWAIAVRGETYREMERYEEALADLNRAIELDPGDGWAIAHRGETYRRWSAMTRPWPTQPGHRARPQLGLGHRLSAADLPADRALRRGAG